MVPYINVHVFYDFEERHWGMVFKMLQCNDITHTLLLRSLSQQTASDAMEMQYGSGVR